MATTFSFVELVYKNYKKTKGHFIYTCQDINDFINSDPDLREFNEQLENGVIMNDPKLKNNIKKMKNLNRDIHTFLTGLNSIGEKLGIYEKKIQERKIISSKLEKGYTRARKNYRGYIQVQLEKFRISNPPSKKGNTSGFPNLHIDMAKVKKNNSMENSVYFLVESYTSPRQCAKTPKSSPLRNEVSVEKYLLLSRSRSKSF